MARPLKDLYKSKCLEDLQNLAGSVSKFDNKSTKLIISSAEKLYAEGEKQHSNGDEELAYIYFFRYLEAISCAQKKEEYKKDKIYYEKLISKTKFKTAIDKLDGLSVSLKNRYDLKKRADDLDSAERDKEFNEALENEKNRQNKSTVSTSKGKKILLSGDSNKASLNSSLNGIIKTNGTEESAIQKTNGITPAELKNLLEQRTKRMLLVDCRDKTDFMNNHINHSNCICIPAPSLTDGMSAHKIHSTLKECCLESYMDWGKRGSFDFIILYDWNSSFDHRSRALNIVYDALTKWDQDCKQTKIVVVQGGMKNMYYTYPNLLTNPQTSVNNSLTKLDGSSDVQDLSKLESISYPDLDDTPPKSIKPRVDPRESVKVSNSVDNDKALPINKQQRDDNDVPNNSNNGSAGVTFDRSTKPSRYASNKLSNGTAVEPTSLPSVNDVPSTDTKVKEYSEALDDVIESTKNVIKSEQEIKKLAEVPKKENDLDFVKKLKEKETEAESLRKQLEYKDELLNKIKTQYEIAIREQKAKHILPRIRTPAEEESIAAKQDEKDQLNKMVAQLRTMRLEAMNKRKNEELPPIASATSGTAAKMANGFGTTQLPSIITPSPSEGTSISAGKPSSTNLVTPSPSRPVSQESTIITRQRLKDENLEPPRSSALKRSHSHPNIAQSHDDDMVDDPPTTQVPKVNRGLKPAGHRPPEVSTPRRFARNFEVVSSTERSKTGLKNLGNTCYLNSIIQCLSHTSRLVDYLRNEEYIKEWHPSRSHTKGEATEELAAAVKQMHSGHRSISLLDLKSTVGKYHPSFRGYEQQDSHEFITILLDWLHEEMNRVAEKTPLKEQKNDGLSDEVAASRAWADYKRSNDSKISELFCGQQKSCVTCASCNRQSVTFEPIYILSVPIPSSGKKCDIQQCIDFYTTEEDLSGWNCVHCKKKVRATKKIDLWRLPPYLIIHLQRFYFDGYWKKRLTETDFPVENLSLNQKVIGRNTDEANPSYDYQLYGVSNHYGSMDGGHYTAYCRLNGNWWKFDDQEVCHINSRDVSTAAAYILFYQNRNYC